MSEGKKVRKTAHEKQKKKGGGEVGILKSLVLIDRSTMNSLE